MSEYRIETGIQGEERKLLVKAIAEYRECISEYCGAPTFEYIVEEIRIDKEGTLIFPSEPDTEDLARLTDYLRSRGFFDDRSEEAETTQKQVGLVLEISREGYQDQQLENLQKIVDSKASLLKKALQTDDLTIEVTDDKICFPWFPEPSDSTETAAYMHLVMAICDMAKNAKRVTAKDRLVESEKYAFRTWLLRLGFVGTEYKQERAILMKHLSGYAAFKSQAEAEAFAKKQKTKRAATKSPQSTEKEASITA